MRPPSASAACSSRSASSPGSTITAGRSPGQAREILTEKRESLSKLSEILIKRETIEKAQFESLLDGQTEEEVFGSEAPPPPEVPQLTGTTAERAGRDAPRPLPRPGLAGGTAE